MWIKIRWKTVFWDHFNFNNLVEKDNILPEKEDFIETSRCLIETSKCKFYFSASIFRCMYLRTADISFCISQEISCNEFLHSPFCNTAEEILIQRVGNVPSSLFIGRPVRDRFVALIIVITLVASFAHARSLLHPPAPDCSRTCRIPILRVLYPYSPRHTSRSIDFAQPIIFFP